MNDTIRKLFDDQVTSPAITKKDIIKDLYIIKSFLMGQKFMNDSNNTITDIIDYIRIIEDTIKNINKILSDDITLTD